LSRAGFLRAFPRVFKGTHVTHRAVSTYRAASVTIESRDLSVPMDVYADGELVGPLPGTMGVKSAALTVRVPAI
jgi:diacylglycerol kinase (ATP)